MNRKYSDRQTDRSHQPVRALKYFDVLLTKRSDSHQKHARIPALSGNVSDILFIYCLHVWILMLVHHTITKTYLYNFEPLKPHFYTVKLGFTGVYIIFHISSQKHRLWVLVRTASVFFVYQFLVVKFSIYLDRRVFVMTYRCCQLKPDLAGWIRNKVNPDQTAYRVYDGRNNVMTCIISTSLDVF